MITNYYAIIPYIRILGLPIVAWLGIMTLTCLLFTAAISVMNKKGIHKIPFSWHPVMARITIAMALIHAIVGLLAYI